MFLGLLLIVAMIVIVIKAVVDRQNSGESSLLNEAAEKPSDGEELVVYTYDRRSSLALRKGSIVTDWLGTMRVIPISQILSFEVRDPKGPARPGRIIIRQAGSDGTMIHVTSFAAVGGSNNLEFPHDYSCAETAHKMQKYIREYNSGRTQTAVNTAPVSAADEIRKYKELLDMGAITQEEFDQKKKELLGL